MNTVAWAAPAVIAFALYLVALSVGVHLRNFSFTAWLTVGVLAELAFATSRVMVRWDWIAGIGEFDDIFGIALAVAAVGESVYRLRLARIPDPVNSAILGWMTLLLVL